MRESGEVRFFPSGGRGESKLRCSINMNFTFLNLLSGRYGRRCVCKVCNDTGEEQNVTVYWDVEEYLPAGTYHVYIFADGTMIGQQAFSMK